MNLVLIFLACAGVATMYKHQDKAFEIAIVIILVVIVCQLSDINKKLK